MNDVLATARNQLLDLLADGEGYLRSGAPLDILRLGQLRWRFARAVGAYQRLKYRALFEPMMRSGSADQREDGRRLHAECLARGGELRSFFARWDAAAIQADSAAYRQAALTAAGWTRRCLAEEACLLDQVQLDPLAA